MFAGPGPLQQLRRKQTVTRCGFSRSLLSSSKPKSKSPQCISTVTAELSARATVLKSYIRGTARKTGWWIMRRHPCGHIRFIFPYTVCMSRYTKANHRVYMQFVRRDVWHVTFLEPGLQTPLPKTLIFKDEGKIRELARRGEAWHDSES